MAIDRGQLAACWRRRNAASAALAASEQELQRAVRAASVEELLALIETFSPARAAGPEWTRTFEPLIEHLWAWRDDATMAELAATFAKRGMPWASVTTALSPEHGAKLRQDLRQPAWARPPAFATA
jgi:hypothetical protein